MRIAIIGSWRESDRSAWELTDGTRFRAAADALGRRLVELGHALVVGSDGHDTADYLAASGAAAACGTTLTRRVHILAPRQKTRPFEDLRRQHPQFFVHHSIPAEGWAPAKVFQVRYAHAVLVLAGAKASRQAGLTAAVAARRLVCIGSFGGAAHALNRLFAESRESWTDNIPDAETLGVLQNPWSDALIPEVLSALRALNKPRILIIHGRSPDRDALKVHLRDDKGLPDPTVLVDEIRPGAPISTKFDEMASKVDAAIALCTPDDVGGLAEVTGGGAVEPRARQNVWLEIGWFWGRLGLRRVLILKKGEIRTPSDLEGVESYTYTESVREVADKIDAFLAGVGQQM